MNCFLNVVSHAHIALKSMYFRCGLFLLENRASNSLCSDAIPDCLFYLKGGTSIILCIVVFPIHINMSEKNTVNKKNIYIYIYIYIINH